MTLLLRAEEWRVPSTAVGHQLPLHLPAEVRSSGCRRSTSPSLRPSRAPSQDPGRIPVACRAGVPGSYPGPLTVAGPHRLCTGFREPLRLCQLWKKQWPRRVAAVKACRPVAKAAWAYRHGSVSRPSPRRALRGDAPAPRWEDHPVSTSKPTTFRVALLNSTPTRNTVPLPSRYLSA